MYVNNLGTRDVAKLHSYMGSNKASKGKDSFAEKLQKAVEQSTAGQDTDSCCEKCKQTSQLVSQMMLRNVFMQSGLGGMGLMGFSSIGMGNLTSYQSMMNMFGNNWLT